MTKKINMRRGAGALLAAVAVTGLVLPAGVATAAGLARSVPAPGSAVAIGDATTQFLTDQLAASWDSQHPNKTQLYSFDATGTPRIVTKKGCASIARPNGATPGFTPAR